MATRLFVVLNGAELRAPTVEAGEKLVVDIAAGHLEAAQIAEVLAHWLSAPALPG